jgi:hypothetical protein
MDMNRKNLGIHLFAVLLLIMAWPGHAPAQNTGRTCATAEYLGLDIVTHRSLGQGQTQWFKSTTLGPGAFTISIKSRTSGRNFRVFVHKPDCTYKGISAGEQPVCFEAHAGTWHFGIAEQNKHGGGYSFRLEYEGNYVCGPDGPKPPGQSSSIAGLWTHYQVPTRKLAVRRTDSGQYDLCVYDTDPKYIHAHRDGCWMRGVGEWRKLVASGDSGPKAWLYVIWVYSVEGNKVEQIIRLDLSQQKVRLYAQTYGRKTKFWRGWWLWDRPL